MRTYFIQAAHGGPIKIGKADEPELRLGQLQTGNPLRLVLLGSIEGDYEAELHERFKFSRLEGEWFAPAKELLGYVESLGLSAFQETCGSCSELRRRNQQLKRLLKRALDEQRYLLKRANEFADTCRFAVEASEGRSISYRGDPDHAEQSAISILRPQTTLQDKRWMNEEVA